MPDPRPTPTAATGISMRELERHDSPDPCPRRLAIIGRGRLGHALAAACAQAGLAVDGPLGRGADGAGADAILLCVPDGEIAAAAAAAAPGPLLGHCSGASGLDVLGAREGFSLHPLMTVTPAGADFAGAGAAVDGTSPRALAAAEALATRLGLAPARIAASDRAAYHAAASVASNFLVTLEAAAERLGTTAGISRAQLAPLVRATVENWARLGPQAALTGPVARGDDATVRRQREAVAARTPEHLDLFDALVGATRAVAGNGVPASAPGPLRTIRTVASLRAALAGPRRAGATIGLVPTMGALHDGHLSLIRRARDTCDVVVVSLFVNPAQFGPAEDLAAYPRDEARDAQAAASAGADVLFAPAVAEVYPAGFATTVAVSGLTERLEGASRGAAHFTGVTTVVAKLLGMVQPDVAFFGHKDAQQAAVVRRMVRDLDLPVRIEALPTVREPDGLAMSSRNAYLGPEDRARAIALRRGLDAAEAAVAGGERSAAAIEAAVAAAMAPFGVEPEYAAVVDPDTFEPVGTIARDALVAVAAQVGPARLIDNTVLTPRREAPAGPGRPKAATGSGADRD